MSTLTERDRSELARLADRANEEHRASEAAANEAVIRARNAGEALNEAKQRTPHGSWGDWVRDNFEGKPRTARLYMRIARNWSRIEDRQAVADLTIRGADRLLRESEDDAEEAPESWPVQPGHAALVTTPPAFDKLAHVRPSDDPRHFWVTVLGEATVAATKRPVLGSHLEVQLEALGFPVYYGTFKPLGEADGADYNVALFESREEQLKAHVDDWKEDDHAPQR